ncbi:MAG: sigma-70 family RNA polymerase sigma factor [Firmicutes bacterium]|nr:sigma-70 family RNA polymerase sigma factor [Bacillota bacterium]MBR2783136.1 sigma-70 family RNA polymerase sigma factor [Bacillota bacterium]
MKIEIRNAQNLSFREKQVVTLKETGASAAAIAKRLGIAESSVATIYSRARTKGYETVIVLPGDVLNIFDNGDHNDE